jgi:hypothetical protein
MHSKQLLTDPVAIVSGVKATDTKVEAAEKAIATMKLAGFSKKAIREAEQMLANYKARMGIR